MPCSGCSVWHGVNPNLKHLFRWGNLQRKKGPNTPNHEQGHFDRSLSFSFHALHSMRSYPYLKTYEGGVIHV